MDISSVKGILQNTRYQISVHANPHGVELHTPANLVLEREAVVITHLYSPEGLKVLIQNHDQTNVLHDTFWECPNYSQRLLIMHNIVKQYTRLSFPSELITWFDAANKEVSGEALFAAILPPSMSKPSDLRLEQELTHIISQTPVIGIGACICLSEKQDVQIGYSAYIKHILGIEVIENDEQPQEENSVDGRSELS